MKPKLMKVITSLSECNYNITKAGKLAGYSNSYAETLLHKTIRKYIDGRSEDEIKAEFLYGIDKDIRRFKREKDNSNYVRIKEMKSKILGLQIERTESKIQLSVNPDEKIELLKLRQGLISPTTN